MFSCKVAGGSAQSAGGGSCEGECECENETKLCRYCCGMSPTFKIFIDFLENFLTDRTLLSKT